MPLITCKNCGRYVPIENKDLGLCATCNQFERDQDDLYSQVRRSFIAMCIRVEMVCPRCRRPVDEDFTIHHKAGRTGYADTWARKLGITLLLDVRFFLTICLPCHQYIEPRPAFAKARGWTLDRLGIIKSPLSDEVLEEINRELEEFFADHKECE